MNILKVFLGLFVFAVISTIYTKSINIMGITPNVGVILITIIGLKKGNPYATIYGLFLGIIYDILIGKSIGLYALIYMYIGYISGALAVKLYNENKIITIISIAIADLFYNVCIYCFYYLTVGQSFYKFFFNIILFEMIYTVIIYILIDVLINYIKANKRAF